MGISFSAEALSKGLRAIWEEQIDVRTDIERHIFEETLRLFNEATAQGLAESYDPSLITDRFLQELRTNNAVFSAFRTHRMQNDLAAQLIDPQTGQLKSFDRWLRDTQSINDHYCRAWLQTEYDTAVIRAHQAADWKHFVEEADVFPNIRWMPTTSITPDPLHQHYWEKRLTLPVYHPFWQEHHPGDRWNCKCSLQQTDDPVNASALDGWTPPLPQPGLDNNPAVDGSLFSGNHPYITESYPDAKAAVEKVVSGYSYLLREAKITDEGMKRFLKTRKELYKNLKANNQYENVRFNKTNGGVMATHIGHNKDPRGWKYEEMAQRVGFKAGHSVIFESELNGDKYQRFTEGFWDGMPFEVGGAETATPNNILNAIEHCADKRKTEVAVIVFPNGGFSEDKIRRALGRYRGLEKLNDGEFVQFRRVVCIQDDRIIYDEPF